jgi:hypothetical protein
MELPDPQNGIAALFDQGAGHTCVHFAMAACIYEQVYELAKIYCLAGKPINLSQNALVNALIQDSHVQGLEGEASNPMDFKDSQLNVRDTHSSLVYELMVEVTCDFADWR